MKNILKIFVSLVFVCLLVNGIAFASSTGVTENQPFSEGTAGSIFFRIPALITLQNGSLFAAVDARWNHKGDACALDTIASYSADNGKTWNYSFPNYFNDSVDSKQLNATAFIDPVLIQGSDGTIYMLADLFPGGVAINTAPRQPHYATGYDKIDSKDRLVLYTFISGQNNSNYEYYVSDFENGFAPVYKKGTNNNPEYYVDDHYYLYDNNKQALQCPQVGNTSNMINQNVFFSNADLHVRDATYLC